MDTIETSNLNRQFLFRNHHVGTSKARVAADSVRVFRPNANITVYQVRDSLQGITTYDSMVDALQSILFIYEGTRRLLTVQGNVKESRFDKAFFGGFALVLNGLDNVEARRHVNRLCLSAGVPLIESGTEGYLGQVRAQCGKHILAAWYLAMHT